MVELENVSNFEWTWPKENDTEREKKSFNFAIYVFEQCANWFCLLCVVSNNFFNAMLSGKRCCDFNLIGAFVFVRVWEMVLCFVWEPYPFDAALGHFSFGLNKSLFTHTHTSVTMHVYCMCWGVRMPKGDKQSEPMNTKKIAFTYTHVLTLPPSSVNWFGIEKLLCVAEHTRPIDSYSPCVCR